MDDIASNHGSSNNDGALQKTRARGIHQPFLMLYLTPTLSNTEPDSTILTPFQHELVNIAPLSLRKQQSSLEKKIFHLHNEAAL